MWCVIETGFGYKAQSWQEASADFMSLLKVRASSCTASSARS